MSVPSQKGANLYAERIRLHRRHRLDRLHRRRPDQRLCQHQHRYLAHVS